MLRVPPQFLVLLLCLSSGTAAFAEPVPPGPARRVAENRTANHLLIGAAANGVQNPPSALAAFHVASALGNSRSGHTQGDSARPPMSAVVVLGVDRTSFDRTEDVILHVTITNPTGHSLRILKWFTPLDGVERSLFTVMRDGERVSYLGKMVKRAAPTDKDYITLRAGESMTTDVDLSEYYALSVSGNYDVKYDVTSIQLYAENEEGRFNNGRLTSNALHLFIEGRSAPAP